MRLKRSCASGERFVIDKRGRQQLLQLYLKLFGRVVALVKLYEFLVGQQICRRTWRRLYGLQNETKN